MLSNLKKYKVEEMPHMVQTKDYGLTALDIAGRINAQDAIDEYLEYFLD